MFPGVCALVYVCRCLCVQKSMYKHACLHIKSNCGSCRAPAGLVLSANVHWLGHVWGPRHGRFKCELSVLIDFLKVNWTQVQSSLLGGLQDPPCL